MAYSTMGVEKARPLGASTGANERGQSIIEFLLMLPVLIGVTMLLVRINTAIQSAIVNQQYARAQTLWLTFNSPVYPQLRLRTRALEQYKFNQMTLGVSDNAASDAEGDGLEYVPRATVKNITGKSNPPSDDAQTEPPQRGKVRIRDTVTLCAPTVVIDSDLKTILPTAGPDKTDTRVAIAPYALTETTTFPFCRSPL